jgi:glycosyltransferase involved in cell wall biosynthesis
VRVLLCVHHVLDRDRGAPGATLALGSALVALGCEVEFLGFDQVFGNLDHEQLWHHLLFPWAAGGALRRRAGRFDVIDASTGDAWVWVALGRPGGRRAALVTRAHGLEHVAAQQVRESARENGGGLSWKYPVYHGGLRLWEVRRSLRSSEHCVFLNMRDRDYARDRLGLAPARLTVLRNGIADHFHGLSPPQLVRGALRLAFVGRWTIPKGKDVIVETAAGLDAEGIDFRLSLLGTMDPADEVLADFPEGVRWRVSVTPRFRNEQLPELLAGHEIFVFPSRSEGSSAALVEAMACGLAPVATPVGAAPEMVTAGSGVLAAREEFVGSVAALGADRASLLEMRSRAYAEARHFHWDEVARRTLGVYRRALAARSAASRRGVLT